MRLVTIAVLLGLAAGAAWLSTPDPFPDRTPLEQELLNRRPCNHCQECMLRRGPSWTWPDKRDSPDTTPVAPGP